MSAATITNQPPRTQAIAWAQRIVANFDAVYLDTETTGIGDDAEIVDIAIIANDGQVLFESLVRPNRPVPIEASRIHGIYDDDVASAPRWPEVADRVFDLIADRYVVVYNVQYDRTMLKSVSRACLLLMPKLRWGCAMLAYASFVGEPGRYDGFRWHKLAEAAQAFGIEPGGHRAAADADACRQVVHAMARTAPQFLCHYVTCGGAS